MTIARHRPPVAAWRRKAVIVTTMIGALVGAVLGLLWSSTQDAGYESTGTVFVAFTFPPEEPDPFAAAQFVKQRIDTYAELGTSPEVLQAVATDVGAGTSTALDGKVVVAAVPGTVLLRVTASDSDRVESIRLAESVMTNLNKAAMAVEAGRSPTSSPISLVPIQPPLAGPATSIVTAMIAVGGGLLLGAILGGAAAAALGRLGRR